MAKFPIKLLPLVGVVFLLSVIGFFLVKSEKEDIEDLSHDEMVPTADISAEKFKVTEIDSDKDTIWVLEADGLNSSENEDKDEILLLERFRLKFQKKDGFDLDLEGNNAKYNREKKEIILSGDIKGETSTGYMFNTEHIMINLKENSLKTDEVVTFVGPFLKKGTGKGLFIDLEKETLEILKNVISILDKESLTI